MAFRRVVRWAVDEAGNVIGGTGYEGRLYLANTSTLASVKLDSAGALAASNPHSPNAGTQTSSSANMLTTDDTIAVLSSSGFAVGDLVPIDGSAGRFYGVIRTIVDGTHIQFTQTLAAMGGAATMNSGALVGGPEMTGHWQGFVADTSDYDFTLKNLATGKEGPPEGVATLSTAGTLVFQEEGVDTATRPKLNFIGGTVTLTDNAGQNRGDVTILDNQTYITTASESSLSNERVLGTTVFAKGTLAGRPAASTSGYLYWATDPGPNSAGALYRDTGAAWDFIAIASAVDVQKFSAGGTWTKPTNFTPRVVEVHARGPGGGGAGGGNASGANAGGGGGAGAYVRRYFDPATLGATETVTIGAGGTGGASNSVGNAGGTTSFGAHISVGTGAPGAVPTTGTGGGGSGTAGAGSGQTGGDPRPASYTGANQNGGTGAGGGPANTVGGNGEYGGGGGAGGANTGAGLAGGSSEHAGGAGGGGGFRSVTPTNFAGGAGGAHNSYTAGGGGAAGIAGVGAGVGGAGGNGTSRLGTGKAGDGGGGGGGGGTGGLGGNGGAPSGGGGGGGTGSGTGGAGGNGADGEVIVLCYA